MVVGMVTVFAILFIVIYIGKLLIAVVNKYAPEEAPAKRETPKERRRSEREPAPAARKPRAAKAEPKSAPVRTPHKKDDWKQFFQKDAPFADYDEDGTWRKKKRKK